MLELPSWLDATLAVLFWGLIVSAILWIALSVIDWRMRRAYNLTVAESSRGGADQPGFLTVDHGKRREAMARAEAYDAQLALRDEPVAAVDAGVAAGWAKASAMAMATLSLVTGVLGALLRVEWMQSTIEKFTAWDRLVAVVQQNTLGFAIALLMILAVLVDYVVSLRRS